MMTLSNILSAVALAIVVYWLSLQVFIRLPCSQAVRRLIRDFSHDLGVQDVGNYNWLSSEDRTFFLLHFRLSPYWPRYIVALTASITASLALAVASFCAALWVFSIFC